MMSTGQCNTDLGNHKHINETQISIFPGLGDMFLW